MEHLRNGGVTLTNGAIQQTEESDENWEEYLYVPTMIDKFDDTYFIIDCWNSPQKAMLL